MAEICRKAGISQATYFNWKKKYAGLMPSEMRRLKQLEDENGKLKRIVADLSLDKEMLQDVHPPKALRPVRKRKLVDEVRATGRCRSAGPARRFRSIDRPTTTGRVAPDQAALEAADQGDLRDAGALRLPARSRPAAPRGLGGEREADLPALPRVGPAIAQQDAEAAGEGEAARGPHASTRPNEIWAMDFVHDQLATGRKLRVLTVVDTFSRFSPAIDPRFSYRGADVVQTLGAGLRRQSAIPKTIRVDQGTEFVSRDLDLWAYQRGVTLDFSRPGKPTDNAFIEAFNGKFRAECLNAHWFLSLADARQKMEAWRRDYNEERPHGAIGNKPPISLLNGSSAPPPA